MSDRTFPARDSKPRDRGVTIVSDHLLPVEKGFLAEAGEFMDYAKIGLSLPLIADRGHLLERIRNYHDAGVKVMSGGTLIQVAYKKGIISQVIDRLRTLGFDTVELSESAVEIPLEKKREILDKISSSSMEYLFEVGKKEKTSGAYLISKIEEALDLKSPKVVLEAGEGRGVGFFDVNGEISWETLNEIVGRFGPPSLIFESPERRQRSALILEFGPGVNLASVPLGEILETEMQRLGLTTETLGLSPSVHNVEGSPAVKFVYHLIRTEHPIDQAALMQK